MHRPIFIITLVVGLLAAPFLCDAGVTAHECHCDSSDCCVEGAACEPDPCDDVRQDARTKHELSGDVALTGSFNTAPVLQAGEAPTTMPMEGTGNRPYSDSDLPLRV